MLKLNLANLKCELFVQFKSTDQIDNMFLRVVYRSCVSCLITDESSSDLVFNVHLADYCTTSFNAEVVSAPC